MNVLPPKVFFKSVSPHKLVQSPAALELVINAILKISQNFFHYFVCVSVDRIILHGRASCLVGTRKMEKKSAHRSMPEELKKYLETEYR